MKQYQKHARELTQEYQQQNRSDTWGQNKIFSDPFESPPNASASFPNTTPDTPDPAINTLFPAANMRKKTAANERKSLYHMIQAALFCAMLCVIAPITIPTPAGIGFTLGVLGIFLIGAFLPPLWAAGAALCYLVLGCIGVPVFSGWHGGIDVLLGVTGGYLMAYVPMAVLLSLSLQHGRLWQGILGVTLALGVCYLIGTAWYVFFANTTWKAGFLACVVPFIPFDLLKGAAALGLWRAVQTRLRHTKTAKKFENQNS